MTGMDARPLIPGPSEAGAAVAGQPANPVVEPAGGREAWLEALIEISRQLLNLTDGVGPVIHTILEHVRQLSQARTVTFVGPSKLDDRHFEVRVATGAGASDLLGNTYDKKNTLEGGAMQQNRGFLSTAQDSSCHHLHTDTDEPAGSLLAVPFDGPEDEHGAIVASRGLSQSPFSNAELVMAEDFARQCNIALQLAEVQAVHEQLRFRERRDAEARELHDELIQQLFGLGVTLETLRNLHARPAPGHEHDADDLWYQSATQIDDLIGRLRATLVTSPAVDS